MCDVAACDEPPTWTFEASGPPGAFEVLLGCLVEPGDKLRLCDPHQALLRAECAAREDCTAAWLADRRGGDA